MYHFHWTTLVNARLGNCSNEQLGAPNLFHVEGDGSIKKKSTPYGGCDMRMSILLVVIDGCC